MWFHSIEFLILAPIALFGHALLQGQPLRLWLLVMSYIFYGWGQPWACLLLFTSSFVDWIVTRRLDVTPQPGRRKAWLALSLITNLGLLGTFKYLPFVAMTINRALSALGWDLALAVPQVALPPGISFYTFQTMAYTIDVYRGRIKACRSFTTMALFVAFFPTLVAGPIERATDLLGQLEKKQPLSAEGVLDGISRILWGFVKKLVFADWLALFVNEVYGAPTLMSSGELLLATYAFAFQIYLDFSAYSDIAVGLSRLMGVRMVENFRWPYLSRNLSEFWSRWHITLSTWLRDYLFIPLGGSRLGMPRTVLNVLIVMVLGGLWHGAANKFILWGLWIGAGLAIAQLAAAFTGAGRDPERPIRWNDLPGILLTFHWILISWVFFRASSASEAFAILSRWVQPWEALVRGTSATLVVRTAVLVGVVVLVHVLRGTGLGLRWERLREPAAVGVLWGGLLILLALAFAPAHEPFIYFQF